MRREEEGGSKAKVPALARVGNPSAPVTRKGVRPHNIFIAKAMCTGKGRPPGPVQHQLADIIAHRLGSFNEGHLNRINHYYLTVGGGGRHYVPL